MVHHHGSSISILYGKKTIFQKMRFRITSFIQGLRHVNCIFQYALCTGSMHLYPVLYVERVFGQ